MLITNKLEPIAREGLVREWPGQPTLDFICKNFVIKCPECNSDMQVANRTLYHKGKWASIKCQHCDSTRTARRWHCNCSIPWPGCEYHAPTGYACHRRIKVRKESPPLGPLPPSSRLCLPRPSQTVIRLTSLGTVQRQGLTVEKKQHALLDSALVAQHIRAKRPRISAERKAVSNRPSVVHNQGQRKRKCAAASNVAAVASIARLRNSRAAPVQSIHDPG